MRRAGSTAAAFIPNVVALAILGSFVVGVVYLLTGWP